MPLPQMWLGDPLAPFRRNGEQRGGGLPRAAAASEVTPPQPDETPNARKDTKNALVTVFPYVSQ